MPSQTSSPSSNGPNHGELDFDDWFAQNWALGQSESGFSREAELFAKALDTTSFPHKNLSEKRAGIFRLADIYHELAAGKARHLSSKSPALARRKPHHPNDASSQDSMDIDEPDGLTQASPPIDVAEQCRLELQTWDLLRRLLPLRYSSRKSAQPTKREHARFCSTSELWEEFLVADPLAQERKAILESLQSSAEDSGPDIDKLVRELQQKAERGDIIAYGWLHTRSAIKMQKNIGGWTGVLDPSSLDVAALDTHHSEPLVTQLDPDVATRQGRKLLPQDEYFERAIWRGCFELLRRGRNLADIREWCVERTEVWRAVSMSAIPLSKDNETERSSCDPLSALLWRRTCFALARQGGVDDYERAVYGALSGDIPSVEKVCSTWDDYVFAHYNALLRSQFDAYLMSRASPETLAAVAQSFPSFNAVQFHGDSASVNERLMSSLESRMDLTAGSKKPLKALQAAIISNSIDRYVYEQGLVMGQLANKAKPSALIPNFNITNAHLDTDKFFRLDDHCGLRILSHVYLQIATLNGPEADEDVVIPDRRAAQENVLVAYISALRLHNMVDLLPLYCSQLRGDRAFFTLSRNVSEVTEPEERRMLLRIMEKLGMDIAEFVVFQPNSLMQAFPVRDDSYVGDARFGVLLDESPSLKYGRPLKPDFFGDAPEDLDKVDEQLIQSLEWMLLVDGLWSETFEIGTAIYKRFLKSFNLHAARVLSERVKCSDVFKQKAGLTVSDDSDSGWLADFGSARLGTDSNEADVSQRGQMVADARNFYELECLVRTLDSMETIASSEGMAQDPTEALGRDFWAHVGHEVKLVKAFMQPLLKGWLLETNEEDDDLQYLRDAYLPETVLGYVSVLHFAGTCLSRDNLLECMELAALIAEKDSDVALTLMKSGRMEEMVEGFANCSKALAISVTDKKGAGGSSKKMREMGWSRDLWSVKR